jgi:hypothetical protein
MDLETAPSESALLDRRGAILRAGLLRRRADLRYGWRHLITAAGLRDLGSTAARVEMLLSGQDTFHDWRMTAASRWTACDASLPESLILIGVGESITHWPSAAEPTPLSCTDFKKFSSKERVEALCVRYRCPLNIGAKSESEMAEELLRQLMVVDRAKLEIEAEFEVDEILLKLNLTAIGALLRRDLRFLDALNYFYELPSRSLACLQCNPQLLAAWLCLYAQLLCVPDW